MCLEFTHGYVVNLYEYPGNERSQFFSSIVNQLPHFKIVKGIPENDEKNDKKETATNLSSGGERILHLIPLHLRAFKCTYQHQKIPIAILEYDNILSLIRSFFNCVYSLPRPCLCKCTHA